MEIGPKTNPERRPLDKRTTDNFTFLRQIPII